MFCVLFHLVSVNSKMNIHSDFQILIISGRDHLTAVIQVLDLTLTLFSVLMNKMNIQMMLVMY